MGGHPMKKDHAIEWVEIISFCGAHHRRFLEADDEPESWFLPPVEHVMKARAYCGNEIGYLLADRDPVTRENRFNGLDLLRLAIPRRVYTDNHMNVIAAALKNVYDRRETITRGVRITWEAPLMRHFTVQLERL